MRRDWFFLAKGRDRDDWYCAFFWARAARRGLLPHMRVRNNRKHVAYRIRKSMEHLHLALSVLEPREPPSRWSW